MTRRFRMPARLPEVYCPPTMPLQLLDQTTGKVYWKDMTWDEIRMLIARDMKPYDEAPKKLRDQAKLIGNGGTKTHPREVKDLLSLDPTIKLRDLLDLT